MRKPRCKANCPWKMPNSERLQRSRTASSLDWTCTMRSSNTSCARASALRCVLNVHGGNKARARSTAHKRYSVADPTAMSQSWHAADHQSSPRASNGGGRLLGVAHGPHRSNQSSHSLPRGSSEGFQPRMRRSMSETSPPQDACVQQLFASFAAADVSGDSSVDDSLSAFENTPCSQDDLLRLTWVKEDGDLLQQDSESTNTSRVDSSS